MSANDQPSVSWAERGAFWASTTPEGLSDLDHGNQAMIAAAEIKSGNRVLDIASGAGDPSISIAVAVGPSGHVTAYDLNAEMLAGAEKRARNLNLENMAFKIGDMSELPFGDASFDAVTCRFALMFTDDPVSIVREAVRVLKPGGRIVYMVHGAPEKNTFSPLLRQTVLAHLEEEGSETHNRRHRYSDEGELREILTAAGLEDVVEEDVREIQQRPAEGRFWQRLLDRTFGHRLAECTDADVEELHAKIAETFAPYHRGDHYELLSTDRIGSGRKPS